MKTNLLKTMVLALALMPVGAWAQSTVETYDFGSWTKKSAVNQTLNLESFTTSTSGKTVYLLDNFVDKDEVSHSLNGRFAFEKTADENPYGWQKFCGYSKFSTITDDLMTCGLQLKQKNLTISILNLKAGDVVTVWHNGTLTHESSEDGLYITSQNVSYEIEGATKVITTNTTKTAGNALVSGTPYTMVSDGSLDFTYSSATESYIRKVTITTVGTNGIHIGSTGYATFSNTSAVTFAGTGVQVFWASNYADGKVQFTEITSGVVPANTGVLLKAAPGNYTYAATETSDKYNENLLKYIKDNSTKVKEPETAVGKTTTNYLLAQKSGTTGFYKVEAQRTGLGGKAYLQIITDEAAAREVIDFDFGGETTGISDTMRLNNKQENNNAFDLQGRRVDQPRKGLYIVNGKKVIVK